MYTETLMLPTNGIHLHVEAAGPRDGKLVILLHGFPEFWGGWIHQIEPLAEAGLRVVVPDQRGYNLSDKPKGIHSYRLEQLALDITGLIDAFGRERACIVGHDWGAAVAWNLASFYPERVEKLAVLNVPHMGAMQRALRQPLWRQVQKSWYVFAFQIPGLPEWNFRQNRYRTLFDALVHSGRRGAFTSDDQERLRRAWSQPGALTAMLNWYRAGMRSGLGRYVRRVPVPTRILWGDRDDFLEPVLADWSLDWVDQGQVTHFPEATHWLAREEPAAVNRALIEFLCA